MPGRNVQYGSGDNAVVTRDEYERLVAWRGECLFDAGMQDPELGAQIALDFKIDIHKACDMLRAGCSDALLVQILC